MAKKILYVTIIIVLIIAGINIAKKMSEENKTKPTVTNTIENENEIKQENILEEDNNTLENIITEENMQEEKAQESENKQPPEERAKNIVKENWGEDDSVYYSYDGINSEGKYIICVRDKSTTKALYWYYVDIETGAFDIK